MSFFQVIFFGPKLLADAYPAAPFVFAGALIVVQLVLNARASAGFGIRFFRLPAVFAGVIWAIYGLYEPQVRAAFPDAGIRIDLLVLVPILYVFTALALWSVWMQVSRRSS